MIVKIKKKKALLESYAAFYKKKLPNDSLFAR